MSKADRELNLEGEVCPLNFVKTKLALEEMESGQVLEVILDSGEPIQNVPRSVREDGHKIIKVQKLEDETFKILIEKV